MFKNLITKNPELNKYYLKGLAPFAIIVLVLELTSLDIMVRFFIYIGFIWPYAIETPGLKEKIQGPKYRFSFMKFVLVLDQVLASILMKISIRYGGKIKVLIPPFVYCTAISLMAEGPSPFYALIGSVFYLTLFEVFYKRR